MDFGGVAGNRGRLHLTLKQPRHLWRRMSKGLRRSYWKTRPPTFNFGAKPATFGGGCQSDLGGVTGQHGRLHLILKQTLHLWRRMSKRPRRSYWTTRPPTFNFEASPPPLDADVKGTSVDLLSNAVARIQLSSKLSTFGGGCQRGFSGLAKQRGCLQSTFKQILHLCMEISK